MLRRKIRVVENRGIRGLGVRCNGIGTTHRQAVSPVARARAHLQQRRAGLEHGECRVSGHCKAKHVLDWMPHNFTNRAARTRQSDDPIGPQSICSAPHPEERLRRPRVVVKEGARSPARGLTHTSPMPAEGLGVQPLRRPHPAAGRTRQGARHSAHARPLRWPHVLPAIHPSARGAVRSTARIHKGARARCSATWQPPARRTLTSLAPHARFAPEGQQLGHQPRGLLTVGRAHVNVDSRRIKKATKQKMVNPRTGCGSSVSTSAKVAARISEWPNTSPGLELEVLASMCRPVRDNRLTERRSSARPSVSWATTSTTDSLTKACGVLRVGSSAKETAFISHAPGSSLQLEQLHVLRVREVCCRQRQASSCKRRSLFPKTQPQRNSCCISIHRH